MNENFEKQLEDRRRNLAVVKETIVKDPIAGQRLIPVRDFLIRRIEQLERELSTKKTVIAYS